MKENDRSRRALITHYQTYPELQVQDIFKFIHQSTFGCEHLIDNTESITKYICDEYEKNANAPKTIEALDGDYARVSLGFLADGLAPETLAALMRLAAGQSAGSKEQLEEKLLAAKALIGEGALPFSADDFSAAVSAWRERGSGAVHHSEDFRREYAPAYRVIRKEYVPFLPLFCEIDKRCREGRVILAVEGGSASGKTTLSALLKSVYACEVIHADDFFLRPEQRTDARLSEVGGNMDRERLEKEVLKPLREDRPFSYRPFDCQTMSLLPPISVEPNRLTVMEGVYSLHPELEKFYNLSVFLDISEKKQQERIKKRNTPEMAQRFFKEWIPREKIYFSQTATKARCDLCISI